jgi:HEAT repeat protein
MIHRLSDVLHQRVALTDLLLGNLEHDDDPVVRASAVETLFRDRTDHALRERAASGALADHDPQVRFAAARHLGERGFDVIAEIIGVEILHESVQLRALRYLARTFPDRAQPILAIALSSKSEQLQATAIQLMAETADRSWAVHVLSRVEPQSYFNATRLAEVLGALGPSAEQALIELLYFRARRGLMLDLDMRIAVADALGRVGSLLAIRHLYPYAEGHLHDENLRLAAATAIEIIQARFGGASGGGALSLVEPPEEVGKLSVADEKRGLISSPVVADVLPIPARPPDDTG